MRFAVSQEVVHEDGIRGTLGVSGVMITVDGGRGLKIEWYKWCSEYHSVQ